MGCGHHAVGDGDACEMKPALVMYCRSFTNEIVKAYAQDHFFDVNYHNVIGLVAALFATYIEGWIDPVGAIILAIYTVRTWSMTVLENVHSLVGQPASREYLQELTYLCWNHHEAVRHIDTVRAYTSGSHYFVEVDIVLPSIGHAVAGGAWHRRGPAGKLERLPEIERAFVHLGYEFTHRPEHALSQLRNSKGRQVQLAGATLQVHSLKLSKFSRNSFRNLVLVSHRRKPAGACVMYKKIRML